MSEIFLGMIIGFFMTLGGTALVMAIRYMYCDMHRCENK